MVICLREVTDENIRFATIIFPISALTNIFFIIVLMRSNSLANPVYGIQGLFMLSTSCSNIITALVSLTVLNYGSKDYSTSYYCDLIGKIAEVVFISGYCCTFTNYILLNFNRYMSCKYPLKYTLIFSKIKAVASIVVTWIASYTCVSLALLGRKQNIEGYLLTFRKSSFGIFTTVYVLCVVIVMFLNTSLWKMGYRSYLNERRQIGSISNKDINAPRIQRSHLKSTLIAFVLTMKNILCFCPFVIVIHLRMNGCDNSACTTAHRMAGPLTALSLFSDPLISIFVMKEVKMYILRRISSFVHAFSRSRRIGMATSFESNNGNSMVTAFESNNDD